MAELKQVKFLLFYGDVLVYQIPPPQDASSMANKKMLDGLKEISFLLWNIESIWKSLSRFFFLEYINPNARDLILYHFKWTNRLTATKFGQSVFSGIFDIWPEKLFFHLYCVIYGPVNFTVCKLQMLYFCISRTKTAFDLKFSSVIVLKLFVKFQFNHLSSWCIDRSVNF